MEIKQEGLKTGLPEFRPGDTVRIHNKVVEGDSERIQYFDGVVIGRKGSGIAETFTVRKVSFGVGIERIFPLHSPRVEKIEVLKQGRVRRAKLFYLRGLSGKAARLDERTQGESGVAGGTKPETAVAPVAAPAPAPAKPAEQAAAPAAK